MEWKYWCVGLVLNLLYVNKLLIWCEENSQKPNFDPFISIPGVKIDVNTMNVPNLTPLFPL